LHALRWRGGMALIATERCNAPLFLRRIGTGKVV
jgi:hypothetical protein